MNDAFQQVLWRLFIPGLVASALALSLGRSSAQTMRRYAFAAPVAIAFFVGHLLNPDRLPLWPQRHWQWLPYLAIAAAGIGGIRRATQHWWERLQILPLFACIAVSALLLLPRWQSLESARPLLFVLLNTYLLLPLELMIALPERLRGRSLLYLTTAVLLATVVYIGVEVSLKVGASLAPALAGMGGVCLASFWLRHDKQHAFVPEMAGLIPVFTLIAGGGAFVGAIESPEPRYLLLLIPASPLMLWLFVWGPLARLTGTKAVLAQTLTVAVIPVAIFAWTFLQPKPADDWSAGLARENFRAIDFRRGRETLARNILASVFGELR